MSKEGFIPKNNAGEEMVLKRANELQKDFDFKDMGDPKFRTKRFLKSLLLKVSLKNDVDPEKYTGPYILYPTLDDAFLVLERNSTTGTRPDNESTKGLSSDYKYTEVLALGYAKVKDGWVVGIFGKKDNDLYLYNHQDDGDFNPKDTGMLFTKTVVSEEDIVLTLALAMASYEYNKGKPLNDQITFPTIFSCK